MTSPEPRSILDGPAPPGVGAESVTDGTGHEWRSAWTPAAGIAYRSMKAFSTEELLWRLWGLTLLAIGTVLGGSAFWYTVRRWVRGLDKAPSETAKGLLGQIGNTASAGVKAASDAGSKAGSEGSAAA
jgi:hypothetical protein